MLLGFKFQMLISKTKTIKTPLCVCGLRPLCFSREASFESELSSRSQDNHRFVPNHRPPSAKTPGFALKNRLHNVRCVIRCELTYLTHLLSAFFNMVVISFFNRKPEAKVRGKSLFFSTKCGVLERSSTLFINQRKFVATRWSEFRMNCGWLGRRARARSQARSGEADTKVEDLRPPKWCFFLFFSFFILPSPLQG